MTDVVGVAAGRLPRLAVAPDGEVVAAWCEGGDIVLHRVGRTAGELGRVDAGGPPLDLAVALAPTRAVVAWTSRSGEVVALPGGRVSAGPATLCAAAAGGPAGGAVVAWGAGGDVVAAADDGTGGWSEAERVGAGFAPQVAVGPDGTALAAWAGQAGEVRVAERPPDGRWTPARALTADWVGASGLRLVLAADGWSALAWTAADATVRVARRAPRGGWGAPVAVSAPGEPSYAPRVAAGPRGALVTWHRADMMVGGAWLPWDGPPGAPAELSGASGASVYPAPAVGPDGALVAWRTHDGAVVARSAAGGTWDDPQRLAPPGATAGPPVTAVGPGRAVVAWEAAAR